MKNELVINKVGNTHIGNYSLTSKLADYIENNDKLTNDKRFYLYEVNKASNKHTKHYDAFILRAVQNTKESAISFIKRDPSDYVVVYFN